MPGKVKVTPHFRNKPTGGRTHVRGQNRNPPRPKTSNKPKKNKN